MDKPTVFPSEIISYIYQSTWIQTSRLRHNHLKPFHSDNKDQEGPLVDAGVEVNQIQQAERDQRERMGDNQAVQHFHRVLL